MVPRFDPLTASAATPAVAALVRHTRFRRKEGARALP